MMLYHLTTLKAKLKAAISDDISDWGITQKQLKFQIFNHLTPCKLMEAQEKQLNVNVIATVTKSRW